MLGTCLGGLKNLFEGRLSTVFLEKLHLGELLSCWNSTLDHVRAWLPKGDQSLLYWPCALQTSFSYEIRKETADSLLCLLGLPGLFTARYFLFQAPKGFPKIQLDEGSVPRDLWVLLLCGQPGEGVGRHRWVPSSSSSSDLGALDSQGKGQITTVSFQINLEVQFHSYKGWDQCDRCNVHGKSWSSLMKSHPSEQSSAAMSGVGAWELILSSLGCGMGFLNVHFLPTLGSCVIFDMSY